MNSLRRRTWWPCWLAEEKAQILYLTLVMMMLLTLFTLVLVNVIYIATMKIKVQNAADALALSVAAKRADTFNRITEVNAFLDFIVRVNNTKSSLVPYLPHERWLYLEGLKGVGLVNYLIAQYNSEILGLIEQVCQGNGLKIMNTKVGLYSDVLYPYPLDFSAKLFLCWTQAAPPPALPVMEFCFLKDFEPLPRIQAIQTRVLWQTRENLIGMRRFGIQWPDLITRARVAVVDQSQEHKPWSRDWEVQLKPAAEVLDEYIQRHMQ